MIIVEAIVQAPIEKVWDCWNKPEHIVKWNFASDDWECPSAENDLRVGGRLVSRMQAKDGSFGFDFGGTYTEVEPMKKIAYTMDGDGRRVEIRFESLGEGTRVEESFDPESENSEEMQRGGWQAILNNFKQYAKSR
jgi:uncharacterized protein YndB with AHSA1/START domain